MHTIKISQNENDYMFVRSLCVTSQQEGLIMVSIQGTLRRNEADVQCLALAAYDLRSGAKLGEIETYANAYTLEFSRDGTRLLTDVRPGGDYSKCLDLFDLSSLRKGGEGGKKRDDSLKLVASLKPDTDTRFNFLTADGKTLCVGLAGIEGVTFFDKCVPKDSGIDLYNQISAQQIIRH